MPRPKPESLRRARQTRLLVEDIALRRRPAGAAMLLRPGRRDPAAFVKRAVPAHIVVLGDIHARDDLVPDIGRQLVANEGAHLLAEVFLGPAELHRRSPSCRWCRSLARRSHRCHGLRLVRAVDPDGSTAVRRKAALCPIPAGRCGRRPPRSVMKCHGLSCSGCRWRIGCYLFEHKAVVSDRGSGHSVPFPRLCVFGIGPLLSIPLRSILPTAGFPERRDPFSRVSRARARARRRRRGSRA